MSCCCSGAGRASTRCRACRPGPSSAAIDRDRYEVLAGRASPATGAGRSPTATSGRRPAARCPRSTTPARPSRSSARARGPVAGRSSTRTRGPRGSLGGVDVAFPVLHGPYGEDGTVQGLLATVGVPFVGADVTASSIGIDKAAMKAAFAARELPQGPYVTVHGRPLGAGAGRRGRRARGRRCRDPWFVKPARQGSSIGISKVADADGPRRRAGGGLPLTTRSRSSSRASTRPRELEVGVLGERRPARSPRPARSARRTSSTTSRRSTSTTPSWSIPADVDAELAARIDDLARAAYRADRVPRDGARRLLRRRRRSTSSSTRSTPSPGSPRTRCSRACGTPRGWLPGPGRPAARAGPGRRLDGYRSTTGQVRVRVMPSMPWIRDTTIFPSSFTSAASALTMTSYGPVTSCGRGRPRAARSRRRRRPRRRRGRSG